jgi:hypothetical protein
MVTFNQRLGQGHNELRTTARQHFTFNGTKLRLRKLERDGENELNIYAMHVNYSFLFEYTVTPGDLL